MSRGAQDEEEDQEEASSNSPVVDKAKHYTGHTKSLHNHLYSLTNFLLYSF